MYARSMSSRIWMVLFDWSSVCGWKIVLNFYSVPISFYKLCQNLKLNLESRSDTMVVRKPYSHTTFYTYNLGNFPIGSFTFIEMKLAVFVKWSTTTHMASSPDGAIGKPNYEIHSNFLPFPFGHE